MNNDLLEDRLVHLGDMMGRGYIVSLVESGLNESIRKH